MVFDEDETNFEVIIVYVSVSGKTDEDANDVVDSNVVKNRNIFVRFVVDFGNNVVMDIPVMNKHVGSVEKVDENLYNVI